MAKPRRRLRWLLWPTSIGVGVVVSVLVFTLAYLRSDDFQRRSTGFIEGQIERVTGEQATLGSVDVDLWPPAVAIDGLNLFDADTSTSIVTAERIRAPLVLRDGGPNLGVLAITNPVIELHLDKQGHLREFDEMPKRDPNAPAKPLKRLPWANLAVSDATLRLHLDDGIVEIAHLAIVPNEETADLTGDLTVQYKALTQAAHLDWPGVVLGPERIEIPALALHTEVLTLEGRVAMPLGEEIDARVKGSARLEALQPLFTKPAALLGHVEFDVEVAGPPNDPTIEAAVLGTDLGLDRPGLNWPLLRYRFGNVAASVEATKDGVDIEKATFQWGDGRVTVWGHITRDLVLEHGHVIGEHVSLDHLLRQFDAFQRPWVDMDIDVDAEISGTLKPVKLAGPMDFGLASLRVMDRPLTDPKAALMLQVPWGSMRGSFDIDATKQVATLHADEVETPRSHGTAHASISTSNGPIDITARFWDGDLRDLRPLGSSDLIGQGELSMHVWGEKAKFQAEGDADVTGFSVTGLPYADHLVAHVRSPDMLKLYFEDAKGLKGTTPYTGGLMLDFQSPMSMDLDLHIPVGGRAEDVVGVFIDLEGLKGEMRGNLSLKGPLYDLSGPTHIGLSDVDLWGEKFTSGEGHGYMDKGVFTLDDLRVWRGDGSEGIRLRGGVDRMWALNMEMVGDGLRLERLDHLAGREVPVTGRLGFMARIDNTLFDPAPHGRLWCTDLHYANKPVKDSIVHFVTDDGITHYSGSLVGDSVKVDGTLGLWREQPYALTARLDRFPAHLAFPVAADGSPVEATVSGDLALSGHFGEDPSPIDIVADASDVHLKWAGQELHNSAPWHYEQHGSSFELERFALVGGATHFSLSARGGDQPLSVAGQGHVDLDLLRMVVPGLDRADGVAEVEVRASGRAPDVEALVEVKLTQGSVPLVRHSAFPGTFEDVTGSVRGSKDGYEIVGGHAGLGGGTVEVRGRIAARDWIPIDYELSGEAHDAQVQWLTWLPPATGDAELRFRGPPMALLLSGIVEIEDMTFRDRIDWEDWVVDLRNEMLVDYAPIESTPYFSMDVELRARDTIRLRNNLVEGTAGAALRVIGDTSVPGLVGLVLVKEDAVAYLQDREFQVRRGEINFREPYTWDPDLDFELVTDIQSRERAYRVNYLITGPYSAWRTETRSDPPLAQSDVNALLWFGMTAEELDEIGELQNAVGQSVADMLLADLFITNQAAQDLRGEFPDLIDRVDIVTGVDARGEYSSDPRLLVEKRFEEFGRLDVTGEIDIFSRNGDSYWRVDKPMNDVLSLSSWYATRQRDRSLPIGGAYGVDLRARWEIE